MLIRLLSTLFRTKESILVKRALEGDELPLIHAIINKDIKLIRQVFSADSKYGHINVCSDGRFFYVRLNDILVDNIKKLPIESRNKLEAIVVNTTKLGIIKCKP